MDCLISGRVPEIDLPSEKTLWADLKATTGDAEFLAECKTRACEREKQSLTFFS